jgi:DNA-directed RNA polymerase specialized sigma24 family protein
MKERVARAAAAAVARGRTRLTGWGVWSRWFPPARAVDPSAFQGPDEPYPRHWRVPLDDLPAGVRPEAVDAALAQLPETWQLVLVGRFVAGRSPEEVAADLGLTPVDEQRVANRALAELRRVLVGDQEPA